MGLVAALAAGLLPMAASVPSVSAEEPVSDWPMLMIEEVAQLAESAVATVGGAAGLVLDRAISLTSSESPGIGLSGPSST